MASLAPALYSMAMSAAVWGGLAPWHLLKSASGRLPLRDLHRWLGRDPLPPRENRRRILIHAVSVGEVAAAEPLIRSLAELEPDVEVILSAGNRDGLACAERLREKHQVVRSVTLLPWDRSRVMERWLARLQPDLVAVVETELWPNLFAASARAGIPACVVNGRIYPRDLERYRLVRSFFQGVLGNLSWIGLQDSSELERFVSIGAPEERLHVLGNLKFDAVLPRSSPTDPRIAHLKNGFPLLVAGSTHAPEERLLLELLTSLRRKHSKLRLLLAPRHIGRCTALVELVRSQGLSTTLWSQADSIEGTWDVLLLDEFGHLARTYEAADVCLIGGSFAKRGGQNPLEPAAHGRAIVIGPHVDHFQGIVDRMDRADALRWVRDPSRLERTLDGLLSSERARAELGARARATLDAETGVAERYARALLGQIAASQRAT